MKKVKSVIVAAGLLLGASAQAEEATMTCEQLQEDYRITGAAEQLAESPDLFGACEEVVMRDGDRLSRCRRSSDALVETRFVCSYRRLIAR